MNVSATFERGCDAEPCAAVIALAIVGIQMLLVTPFVWYLQPRELPADTDIEIVAYDSDSDTEVETTAVDGPTLDLDAPAPTPCTPILLHTPPKGKGKGKDEQDGASDDELERTAVPFAFAFGTDCHSPLNADVLARLVRLRALRTQLDSVLSQTHAQIRELEAMC